MMIEVKQLQKTEVNHYSDGRKDRLINVVIDGRHQTVSERWFREIFAVASGKD